MVIRKHPYSDLVSEVVRKIFPEKEKLTVLEAGCGSLSHVKLPENTYLVGIDTSSEQLGKNELIEEKILGDIQTYLLPPDCFDLVICWNVIEHLQKPIEALENLFQTLKIGGIIILAFPNLISLKGMATKFSPFWFHKLYYRYMGFSNDPFPTYFRFSIRPNNILKLATLSGFSVEFKIFYDLLFELSTSSFKKNIKILHVLTKYISIPLNTITWFKYDFKCSDCILILRKGFDNSSL